MFLHPLRERSDQHARSGELLGAQDLGLGHEHPEDGHHDGRARQHAEELADELLAGIGAQQPSGLEVRQQIRRVQPHATGGVGAHDVGRNARIPLD